MGQPTKSQETKGLLVQFINTKVGIGINVWNIIGVFFLCACVYEKVRGEVGFLKIIRVFIVRKFIFLWEQLTKEEKYLFHFF